MTTISAPVKAPMTEDEFLRLPSDGQKWELVDGEAKAMPAGHEHDAIGAIIISLLVPHARRRGFVAGAQAGFRMSGGNVRSPDVAFTLKERMADGRPAKGFEAFAPDLAIEIISPTEDYADDFRKLGEYFASGAQQVWFLEPDTRRATMYRSLLDAQALSPDDVIEGGDLLPGFACRVSDLSDID